MKQVMILLLMISLLSVSVAAADVAVDAESCILMEKETGTVLYARNEQTMPL